MSRFLRTSALKRLNSVKTGGAVSRAVIAAIESVTRRPGESYEEFVERAAANPIGRRVKLADLEDNSDISRIANPTVHDFERLERYRRAIDAIRRNDSSSSR